MKLLFTGPLLDFSGFAHASRGFAQMLTQIEDMDVVARPLRYDSLDAGQVFETPEWLQSLLQKDLSGVEMAIQMTTCNIEASPVPGVCNALYTFLETDRIQGTWVAKANEFDFLIVPCKANATAMMRSGVVKPIMVCAPPCDADVYEKDVPAFEIARSEGRTIFYNICQLSTKKGVDVLLRAYYAAFADMPDDVLLVLKTYLNMGNRQNDAAIVKQYIESVRAKCRIPVSKHPPVLPLVYTMSDDELAGLHKTGDAYVCSSRGEGWGIPVFDALGYGNTVISHNAGGLEGFIRPDNALIYGGMPSLYFDMPHQDAGLFTGVEQCFEPSPAELAAVMRRYHMLKVGAASDSLDEEGKLEWEHVTQRKGTAKEVVKNFDYRVVHSIIAPQLFAANKSWHEDGGVKFNESVVEKIDVT